MIFGHKSANFSFFTLLRSYSYILLGGIMLFAPFSGVNAVNYVKEIDYTLEQPLGSATKVISFAQYLQLVYNFALGIVGIIAVVLIMFGGMRWIAAAGNQQAISSAKETIIGAVTGLIIAIMSFSILQFVNPNFTNIGFSIEQIAVVPKQDDIFLLDKCSSADFNNEQCLSDSGLEVNCPEIPCGIQGQATTGSKEGENCRGGVCEAGDGSCFRGPQDTANYSCQQVDCGNWVQNCIDSRYSSYTGTNTEYQIRNCSCDYYNDVVAEQNLGYVQQDGLFFEDGNSTEKITGFKFVCTEGLPNDDLATYMTAAPEFFGLTSAPATVATDGLNCGFGCGPQSGLEGGVIATLGILIGDGPEVGYKCMSNEYTPIE